MKLLTLFVVLGWSFPSGLSMHLMRHRPKPLDSPNTWNGISVMTDHAQKEDKDHETRLLPVFSGAMLKDDDSCCINAHILEFYLKHILHGDEHFDKTYPHVRFVRSDLRRVQNVLQPHCISRSLAEHIIVKEFEEKYNASAKKNLAAARNKAVGETIILFHYLFESCNARM
ncbi:hypothetical protein DNTS_030076 [Danionella cerebrum]|uniref:Interleukin 22 n=1 Tax=Danionella cerebrum TaxID=2873325 RepID=A0A553QT83_9TELE|nr:hypothetical protein DNTS_030076 [Danionella translucida]